MPHLLDVTVMMVTQAEGAGKTRSEVDFNHYGASEPRSG